MLILGIDPGLRGAIAWLYVPGGTAVRPMPICPRGDREWYDVPALRAIFLPLATKPSTVYVEQLGPLPGTRADGRAMGGSIANYHRGAATWLVVGLLAGLRIPYRLVLPQVWQRAMLAGIRGESTKERSVWLAQRLFPQVSLLPTPQSRKPHHGLADALLIAEFGRREMAGDRGAQRGLLDVAAPVAPQPEEESR